MCGHTNPAHDMLRLHEVRVVLQRILLHLVFIGSTKIRLTATLRLRHTGILAGMVSPMIIVIIMSLSGKIAALLRSRKQLYVRMPLAENRTGEAELI